MPDPLQYAKKQLQAFPKTKSVDALVDAEQWLESVKFSEKETLVSRSELRKKWIETWFQLAGEIDQNTDPRFDPADVPVLTVAPEQGYTGMPSEQIRDPKIRSQYEKEIAENRLKTERYAFQTKLRRLDEHFTPQLEEVVRTFYSTAPSDRKELELAMERAGVAAARRRRLLAMLGKAK